MSFANCLTGILRRGIKPAFASSSVLLPQQTRNTFILRRKYPLKLHHKDGKPQRFRSKNWIYELVEDTNLRPVKPINVILTSYVPNIGNIGEKLTMKPHAAYNKLLLPGLAVYETPENLTLYKEAIEKAQSEMPEWSSKWAPRTRDILSTLLLSVIVSKDNSWTLQKFHIRAAFRKINIHVPDHAITMPKYEITGPDLDKQNKEFYVVVTINNREKVNVRCRLHHFTTKENEKLPYNDYWKKSEPAIFHEDQVILDSMPGHRQWSNENTATNV
ncbi:39S ribosomal protein L9, mitochondrial [Venturia canescens]|uniref:39S ribosomal protein L9, mitochondrial n=1 Tax=Venturia canescens TaxID=32260 RepID=UPI001C9C1CD7|nr:39S ribosomal protein L9, mitochondrial [Venturia canescens]